MIDKSLYRDPKDFQIGYPKTMQLPPKTTKVGKYKKGGPVQLELPLEQKPSAELIKQRADNAAFLEKVDSIREYGDTGLGGLKLRIEGLDD